jgi:protein SCO1/2
MMNARITRWLFFAGCFTLAYASYSVYRFTREFDSASADRVQQFEDQMAEVAAQGVKRGGLLAAEPASQAPAPVAPFTLTDQRGEPYDTATLRGRVWVASFFFTSCPAICIRLNQAIAGVIGADPASEVHFVSVTCDPENDTPEALTRYAKHFKADPARWTFLTGDLSTIKRIGIERFQVAVEKGTHSDRTFAIDRAGCIRGRFRLTEPDQLEKFEKLLKTLVAEPAAKPAVEASGSAHANGQGL